MLNNQAALLGGGAPPAVGDFESIASATGTGSSGVITFSSIPSTYTHLQIRGIMRNTNGTTNEETCLITMNSDAGSNYATHRLVGNGSTAYAQAYTSGTAIAPYLNPSANLLASSYGAIVVDVLDYASTSKNKTIRLLGGTDYNGSGNVALVSGVWLNNTTAISSITLTSGAGSWTTDSKFALYGIKG